MAKAFITAGGSAVVPIPTYAMYRVVTEQRGGTVVAVPRLGRIGRVRARRGRPSRAAVADAGATVVWLCSPNNPTALAEPDGAIAALLDGLADDAAAAGRRATDRRPRRGLRRVRRDVAARAPRRLPEPHRGPDREQGLRARGPPDRVRVARPEMIARLNPYRPPGSISTVSVTLVTEALLDPTVLEANLARVDARTRRA